MILASVQAGPPALTPTPVDVPTLWAMRNGAGNHAHVLHMCLQAFWTFVGQGKNVTFFCPTVFFSASRPHYPLSTT